MGGPELIADMRRRALGRPAHLLRMAPAQPLLARSSRSGPGASAPLALDGSSDAPALPWPDPAPGRQHGARAEPTVFAAALDPRTASLVRLETDSHRGSFYVRPRLVATTADLVGTASMVDVTTSDGEKVLGLVVYTDPARNLAVMHVPRTGRPAVLSQRLALAPGQPVDVLELLGHDRARAMTIATLQPTGAGGSAGGDEQVELDLAGAPATSGAPVFVNDRAVGLIADQDGGSRRRIMPTDDWPPYSHPSRSPRCADVARPRSRWPRRGPEARPIGPA